MLEGRDAIQSDLDRLERWDLWSANLIRLNNAKCEVLHLDYSPEKWVTESSLAEDWGWWLMSNSMWAGSEHSQPGKPNVFQDKSKEVWPTGHSPLYFLWHPTWITLRALYLFCFSQYDTWIIAYSSGDPSIEKETEAPPLWGQAEKAEAVQSLAKRRLCGNPMGTLQYLKGPV